MPDRWRFDATDAGSRSSFAYLDWAVFLIVLALRWVGQWVAGGLGGGHGRPGMWNINEMVVGIIVPGGGGGGRWAVGDGRGQTRALPGGHLMLLITDLNGLKKEPRRLTWQCYANEVAAEQGEEIPSSWARLHPDHAHFSSPPAGCNAAESHRWRWRGSPTPLLLLLLEYELIYV